METPEEEHPKKRGRTSSSKKGTKQENVVNEQVEAEVPESEKVAKREVESIEDAHMKDVGDDSERGKEEVAAVEAITEDSSSKVDSNDGTKQEKDDVDAALEDEALESEKGVATQEVENVKDVELKDAVDSTVKGKDGAAAEVITEDRFKVDSNEGTKQENDIVDADTVYEAQERVKIFIQIGNADLADLEDGSSVKSERESLLLRVLLRIVLLMLIPMISMWKRTKLIKMTSIKILP